MSDYLALAVASERDGLTLPPGSVVLFWYVHPRAYEDRPVLDSVRRKVREKIAADAPVTADDVPVTEVSPKELHAAWKSHAPMDPPPLGAHALIGHWTPNTPAPKPLRLSPNERADRLSRIDDHQPTFYDLRADALHAYEDVAHWTLPAAWNPGHDPDDPEPRLFDRPVTFRGNVIACHWTDGTTRTYDPKGRARV